MGYPAFLFEDPRPFLHSFRAVGSSFKPVMSSGFHFCMFFCDFASYALCTILLFTVAFSLRSGTVARFPAKTIFPRAGLAYLLRSENGTMLCTYK